MKIEEDDPTADDVAALLNEHVAEMRAKSPPGSSHALEIDALCVPSVTFWTIRATDHGDTDGGASSGELLGCGALLELDDGHGEIKSMRTATKHLRRGVAARLVEHVLDVARRRGYLRLSLETGAQEVFAPARALYSRFGFFPCGPFGNYRPDPNSLFMTLKLAPPEDEVSR